MAKEAAENIAMAEEAMASENTAREAAEEAIAWIAGPSTHLSILEEHSIQAVDLKDSLFSSCVASSTFVSNLRCKTKINLA